MRDNPGANHERLRVQLAQSDGVAIQINCPACGDILEVTLGRPRSSGSSGVEPPSAPDPSRFVVDRDTFSATWHGKTLPMGNNLEFRLLEKLARRPGIYVPISMLVKEIWGD